MHPSGFLETLLCYFLLFPMSPYALGINFAFSCPMLIIRMNSSGKPFLYINPVIILYLLNQRPPISLTLRDPPHLFLFAYLRLIRYPMSAFRLYKPFVVLWLLYSILLTVFPSLPLPIFWYIIFSKVIGL